MDVWNSLSEEVVSALSAGLIVSGLMVLLFMILRHLSARSVHVRDVIAAKLLDKKSKGNYGFVIHFVVKSPLPKYTWKIQEETFTTEDSAVCEQWVEKIQQYAHQEEFKKPRSVLIFINPKAGFSNGVSVFKNKVAPLLNLAGVKTDVIVTEDAKHANNVLMDCDLNTIDGIVSVGGDGTFLQVFDGLLLRTAKDNGKDVNNVEETLDQPLLRIGIIPCGSGQGCVEMATGSKDTTTAALHIITGHYIELDILSVHSGGKLLSYSAMLTIYGLIGDVIKDSENHRGLGPARYMFSIIANIAKKKKFDAEIEYIPVQEPASTHDSTKAGAHGEEWQKLEGSFCGIHSYAFDLTSINKYDGMYFENVGQTWGDGVIYMNLISDQAGRLGFMKHMHRMMKHTNDASEFDFIQNLRVSRYRLRLKQLSTHSADPIPADVVNIDGEAVPLTDPVVDVRAHRRLLKMFGAGHLHNADVLP